MEIDEESRVGPLLSVQSLTPTHYGRIPGHSRKVSVYTTEESTSSRFDQLIDNFNDWLSMRPSPHKLSHWLPSRDHQSDGEEQASHRLSMLSRALRKWRESVLSCRKWRMCVEVDVRNSLRRAFHDWRLHIYHCILDKLADEYTGQRRITTLQAWFHMWHERVCVREGERVLLTRVRSVLEQRLCGRFLCGWARATRLSRWTKVQSQLCVRKCWCLWRGCVARQRSLLEAARKKYETLSLTHTLHTWRRRLHTHIQARDYISLSLLSKCFTVWRELTEWSHTQSALAFMERLHELLCRDHTVTYSTMVSSLTLASRNLRLGDGGLSVEQSTSELLSQQECEVDCTESAASSHNNDLCPCSSHNDDLCPCSSHNDDLCPCSSHNDDLCPCLHTELHSSVEDLKQQLLIDLSHSPSTSHHYIISSEDLTQIIEPPPPVVAMATCCVQHLRLHCCSKAFHSWRLYAVNERLEHAQNWSKWRTTKRTFDCWRQITTSRTQLQNSSTYTILCSCLKRWQRTVKDLRQYREAVLLRRLQLLCHVWAVWRRELVRERVSMWGVRTSRKLLLRQVFIAWQAAVTYTRNM